MKSLHYQAGYLRAAKGGWRAMPKNIKRLTQAWRDWYAGFDACVEQGENPKLTAEFSLRIKDNKSLVCF